MKKLIAAVIASAFAFGVAGSSFAADVQPQQARHHVVKVKKHKAHKAHKKARKAHTATKVQAPKMHQVKMVKKHGHKQVKKAVR